MALPCVVTERAFEGSADPLRGLGALAIQEWAAQCHGADTGLTAQRSTVAGMDSPRESVEQHQGVIPRRVRVVARSCGVRALNARTREQEQVRAGALEQGGPHPRGCLALERGEPHPRGHLALERGGPHPGGV
jgi:hypothetical protein